MQIKPMNKLTINACPLCGSTHLKCAMTCTDFYASGEQFDLYTCEDCGFTFTQGVPVEAEIGRYYETPDYISHSDTKKGAMNAIYHHVRQYMLGRKARLVMKESHRKTGRILDIVPIRCRIGDGKWRPWKRVCRPVGLPANISDWM